MLDTGDCLTFLCCTSDAFSDNILRLLYIYCIRSVKVSLYNTGMSVTKQRKEFHNQQPAHVTAHCYQAADALFSNRVNGLALLFYCLLRALTPFFPLTITFLIPN